MTHLPQVPSPPQGASTTSPARRATASRVSSRPAVAAAPDGKNRTVYGRIGTDESAERVNDISRPLGEK